MIPPALWLTLIASALLTWLAVGALRGPGRASAERYGAAMPQRFHAGSVPRVGGAAMFLGSALGWCLVFLLPGLSGLPPLPWPGPVWAWWLVVVIAVGSGLVEDLSHRVGARWRLLLTLLGGGLAVAVLGLRIGPLDLPGMSALWRAAPWLGGALAVVAIGGLPHAFNLIDGYNGLAGVVAIMCSLALARVAFAVGDAQLAALCLVMAAATAGFLVWNYPRGLMFAGDGGAYLWGAVIALVSVQLVQRHEEVSPWFPALLLIYPVWETLFSVYRKLRRGQSPGRADALHFHQLVYRRVVRAVVAGDPESRMRVRNNRTAPYLWVLTLMAVVPALVFWRDTGILIGFCVLFVATYMVAYAGMVRFRVPAWLRW